jgi:hypothetical protein
MRPDATTISAECAAPALQKQRLHTLESLDGRTRASQGAHAIMRSFEADLGGTLSAGQRSAIRRAAMLSALAEDATARQLAGETVDLDQLVRISNLARRAVLDLHLPEADQRNAAPTLADYAAQPKQPTGELDEEAMDRASKIRELFKRARETPFPSLVSRAEQVRELLETARRRGDAKRSIQQKKT